ncbi:iron-sulfur cluster assembly accessory protein [Rhizobium sp. 007]|nr:iron-sulfur cluster assembly accessory protein [Rhizobium sp. 007]QPB24644.1 iron-sulfur cluster assembly accessory protein [Rhizobium sp. 007]
MVTLTEKAIAAAKGIISQSPEPVNGLRIMVQVDGCAGPKYHVGLESELREGDAVIETGGVKVFVDAGSQDHIAGLTLDFVTEAGSSGFIFDNPNPREKCACGKSCS